MRSLWGCPTELKLFLEDPIIAIKKPGVNTTADSAKLKNDHAVDLQGAVELQDLARSKLGPNSVNENTVIIFLASGPAATGANCENRHQGSPVSSVRQ